MAEITGRQLAAVLEKAANFRRDVKKAQVRIDPAYDPTLLLVQITFYTEGRHYQGEHRFAKYQATETCGKIIESWIGAPPTIPVGLQIQEKQNNATLVRERAKYLLNTPSDVLDMVRKRRQSPPPPPPRKKFDWNAPRPTPENPTGALPVGPPDPVDAQSEKVHLDMDGSNPVQRLDGTTVRYRGRVYREMTGAQDRVYPRTDHDIVVRNANYTRVFTKQEMLDMGWDAVQRKNQYAKQRGKHPSEQGAKS